GREVVLGVDVDRLALHADLPFECGADVVGAVLELQSQHLVDRASDHLLGLQPGQLERAPAAVDDPAVSVAGEERRVRSRVVVVEQLEQVGKPALLTTPRLAAKPGVAVGPHRAVSAVGTNEVVLPRHCRRRIATADEGAASLKEGTTAPAAATPGARTRAWLPPGRVGCARSGRAGAG